MTNHRTQSGFTFMTVLILVIIVGLIGASGYYVSQHNSKSSSSSKNKSGKDANSNDSGNLGKSATPTANVTKDWQTYTEAADNGVSFKYPSDWRLGEIDGVDAGDGVKNVSVTSPNGTEIDLRSAGAGVGGSCGATEHSKTISSKIIAGAPGLYVVSWELLEGSNSLATGLDVMNGSSQSSKVYTEVGNHTACITATFSFTSASSKGYFFGLKRNSKLASGDETVASQILGTLTLE